VCRFFQSPGGCFRGAACRYSHASSRHFLLCSAKKGYCAFGVRCLFSHQLGHTPVAAEEPTELVCGICFDPPPNFGLLIGCDHVFCLTCVRSWRDKQSKTEALRSSNVIKECPVCRAPSPYVVPASVWPHSAAQKSEIVRSYKETVAKIPCKYFIESDPADRTCPFGNDCLYMHDNGDGTRAECRKPVRKNRRGGSRRMYP
ncbi:hypothetical protein BDK51DRAFT_4685, partial [Blyttiomyces helicus]